MSISENDTGIKIRVKNASIQSLIEYMEFLIGKNKEQKNPISNFGDGLLYEENQKIQFKQSGKRIISDYISFCYRGQPSTDYEILPSIARKFEYKDRTFSLLTKEYEIIQTAKYKFPDVFRHDLQPLELLALLQHHGLPTRLLDISDNPLVALFFACQPAIDTQNNKINKDGEVIIFRKSESDLITSPIKNAIADSYRFINAESRIKNPSHTKASISSWDEDKIIIDDAGEAVQAKKVSDTLVTDFYDNIITQSYFIEHKNMYEKYLNSEETITKYVMDDICGQNIIFAYAPIRNQRQLVQQGGYILFPNKISRKYIKTEGTDNIFKYCFVNQICPIDKDNLDGRNIVFARVRIPAESKNSILKDLAKCGVSREMLFPDSEDIVCNETAEAFKSKIISGYINDSTRAIVYDEKDNF